MWRQLKKTWGLGLVILFGHLSVPCFGAEKNVKFTVKDVNGSVFIWKPWGTAWSGATANQDLEDGTLIQVYPDSSAILMTKDYRKNVSKTTNALIHLKAPVVLRVDQSLLRRIEFKHQVIDSFPLGDMQAVDLPKIAVPDMIEAAWQRIISVSISDNLKQLFTKDLQVKLRVDQHDELIEDSILIVRPTEDSFVMTTQLPAEVQVEWQSTKASEGPYEVYLWSAKRPEKTIYATTKGTSYILKFYENDTFYVQVKSRDGKIISAEQRINVGSPIAPENSLVKSSAGKQSGFRPKIWLQYPPAKFATFSAQLPQEIDIGWDTDPSSQLGVTFSVVVIDPSGREIIENQSLTGQVTIRLPSTGAFQWYVRAKNREGAVHGSEIRTITILPQKSSGSDLLSEWVAAGNEGVLYLPDGL